MQSVTQQTPDGVMQDLIYANGQKIARVGGGDARYHLSGTTVQAGYELGAVLPFPANYVVQPGDTICWRQYNSNAVGGINIQFFVPNGGYAAQTAWLLAANDGQKVNQSTVQGQWQYRTASLSWYTGLAINNIALLKDIYSPAGSWSMDVADLAIVTATGAVVTQSPGAATYMQPNDPAWDTSFTLAVTTGVAANDNTVSTTHYYLDDHLGTAQMELSSGGWPVWEGQFTPFGQEIIAGAMTNYLGQQPADGTNMRFKFTGKERDAESGLDSFGARYYASSMGRWMSPDWSAQAEPVPYANLDDPQSLNLYGYVGNNPLSRADADGHVWDWLKKAWERVKQSRRDDLASQTPAEKAYLDHVTCLTCVDNYALAAGGAAMGAGLTIGGDTEEAEDVSITSFSIIQTEATAEGEEVVTYASPRYVVTPSGDAVPIPEGATGPTPVINKNGNDTGGTQYQGGTGGGPGLDSRVTGVRIMPPAPARGNAPPQPNGRVSYNNAGSQTVNPQTGQTVSNSDPSAHIPLKPTP